MIAYVYACPTCGEFEVDQRITDPALDKCPTCGLPVKRLIAGCDFVLKGDGWPSKYYRSKSDVFLAQERAKMDATPTPSSPPVYGPEGRIS